MMLLFHILRRKCAVTSYSSCIKYTGNSLCMVPQILNLRPLLLKFIVRVIRFITNGKYAFYCIY